MKNDLIFLAIPYSHKSARVRNRRFQHACRWTTKLLREGRLVYCPVSARHPLVRYGLPGDFEFCKRFDKKMIGLCDELWVLMFDGWRESKGVAYEISVARRLGKKIRCISIEERMGR